MIEKIEFSVEGQKHTSIYNREEYLLYLERKRKEYVGIHRAQTWLIVDKKTTTKFKGGTPCYYWDCIVNILNSNELIVINPDDSIRYTISAPSELIQWDEYEAHFGFNKHFRRNEYKMMFERIDDYFKYENKYYSIIIVALVHENEPFDAYIQERYLDTETGIFLPFTKEISRRTPNQYAYNIERIELI